MKKYAFLLLALSSLLMWLSSQGVGGKAFEGNWHASQMVDENFASYVNYRFWAGQYSMDGYPPISEEGTYSVILHKEDESSDKYVLLMTPQEGDPEVGDPFLMDVTLYSDGKMTLGSLYSIAPGYSFSRN